MAAVPFAAIWRRLAKIVVLSSQSDTFPEIAIDRPFGLP
jgi:hypothetical protein